MPIVSDGPYTPKPDREVPAQIAAPEYRSAVVDNRYAPLSSLITHVEGSSWTVEYYQQVVNRDSQLSGQNLSQNPVYQQYKKVHHLELKVTTPVAYTQEEDTTNIKGNGVANVYPFLIPNNGDMFIARVNTGQDAVFQVGPPKRKSLYNYAVHEIEFELIGYADIPQSVGQPTRRADLDAKVVQTLDFRLDFLTNGQNPFLVVEDSVFVDKLEAYYHEIVNWYFKKYLSNEYKVLTIPGQANFCYDHFLTKGLLSTVNQDEADCIQISQTKTLNCSGDDNMEGYTIWDVITRREFSLLQNCNKRMGLTSAKSFTRNPMLEGVYHSGITYVVYPYNPHLSDDDKILYGYKPLVIAQLVDDGYCRRPRDLGSMVGRRDMNGDLQALENHTLAPLIHPVLCDDYYVFSKALYEMDVANLSALEICVLDYLQRKSVALDKLIEFCETYHGWGVLEKFYYIPVVLMMIKGAIRAM